MGDCRRHRGKNVRREREASPAAADETSDDVLELVFMRLASLLYLIRAACTCKRWRRIVADSSFLRRFRSLHAPTLAAGHYRVDDRIGHPRPPGLNPVFVPSASPSAIDARHFSLDFLLGSGSKYIKVCWELADSRVGLLLLMNGTTVSGEVVPSARLNPSLVVCEPLTRRYRVIPPSAWSHGCRCFGAFLLDGDADEAGGCIGLSNFRLVCALYGSGVARACVFSSDGGGRWTARAGRRTIVCGEEYWRSAHVNDFTFAGSAGVARACMFSSDGGGRWTAPAGRRTIVCGEEYWRSAHVNDFTFAGSAGRSAYWRMGSKEFFGYDARSVLVLDKYTAEFSSCADSENNHLDWQTEFMYQLAWPPAIRACLTL